MQNLLQTSVVDIFCGDQNKAQYPNIQGCAISQNMVPEKNGDIQYQKSLFGKKFYRYMGTAVANCNGSYYASVGLNAENKIPSSFWVIGPYVYECRPSGAVQRILAENPDDEYGWTFCESGGERPFLLICNGNKLYAYNLYTGELKLVKMPEGITGNTIVPSSVACLGGSIIVSDKNTGYAYYSQPYILSNDTMEVVKRDLDGNIIKKDEYTPLYEEVSVWEGNIFYDMFRTLQYKNAESSSDSIIGLKAVGDVLTVFGRSTIEFWTRSDAEGMTWTRTNYTSNGSLGLKAQRTVGVFDNVIGFLGSGNRSGFGLYTISGTEIQKISPTWLDEMLMKANFVGTFGYGYSYANHSFYVIHFIDDKGRKRSFGFDKNSGTWHERISQSTNDKKIEGTHYVYPLFTREGQLIYGGYNTWRKAALYLSDKEYWYEDLNSDSRAPFIRSRQTPLIIDSCRDFILNAISIEGNFGTCYERGITPKCTLEISKDGGYSYGNTIVRTLPRTGAYRQRLTWNGLGMVRNCVIKWSCNAPMDICLQNASITTMSLNYRF